MQEFRSMIRKVVIGVSLLGVATVALPLAQAQNSSTRGGLSGVVTDATGAVVPNAVITVVGPQGTVTQTTKTDGKYQVDGLTPGLYTVTVKAAGFTT